MLAAHQGQENVYIHQAGNSKQQLQTKTPGARFPKTPLRIPLNDENATHGFGAKGVLTNKGNNENNLTVGKGGKTGKQAMVTPAEPRTARAPLGNKTTNAKARATQNTHGDKDTVKPTTSKRPKQAAPQSEAPKIEVHTDKNPPGEEEEIEYCPPRPKERPYESDILPEGALTFEGLKPENLFNGYYQYYFNRIDENGKSAIERDMEEQQKRNFERGEEQILKDMDEFDWSVGDIPESKDVFKKKKKDTVKVEVKPATEKPAVGTVSKQPSTIAARKAASALAMPKSSSLRPSGFKPSKSVKTVIPPRPQPRSFILPKRPALVPATTNPVRQRTTLGSASRSTLGYSKGRSASSVIQVNKGIKGHHTARVPEPAAKTRELGRSGSTASKGSDATITPARFAKESVEWKKPDFLSIFEADDAEEDDADLGGVPPIEDDEETFQFATDF